MSLEFAKSSLRQELLKKRNNTHSHSRENVARIIIDRFISLLPAQNINKIAGYWPLAGELDCVPLLNVLSSRQIPVGLPVVAKRDAPLLFRGWQPNMILQEGFAGTLTPPESSPEMTPEWLIVPLVGFDRAGYRLGYGGGYYDRTLRGLRMQNPKTRAIGLGYAVQQVPIVPHDGHDEKLDWVITENDVWQCF